MSDRCCVIDCEREAIGTVLIGSYSEVHVCDEHEIIFSDFIVNFRFTLTRPLRKNANAFRETLTLLGFKPGEPRR